MFKERNSKQTSQVIMMTAIALFAPRGTYIGSCSWSSPLIIKNSQAVLKRVQFSKSGEKSCEIKVAAIL